MPLVTGTSHVIPGRALVVTTVAGLSLGAWVALWRLGGSPYLQHHPGHAAGLAPAAFLGFFVLGWTVMTIGMMLPTSVPLLMVFHTIARRHADRGILLALVIAGYLGMWVLFGAIVYLGAGGVAWVVAAVPAIGVHAWTGGGLIVLAAGAFQFTALKYRCLDKCRSPFSFVMEHWRGRQQRWQAVRLGAHHGLFCVGCCWALMLLMFVVSFGNLG